MVEKLQQPPVFIRVYRNRGPLPGRSFPYHHGYQAHKSPFGRDGPCCVVQSRSDVSEGIPSAQECTLLSPMASLFFPLNRLYELMSI